MEIRRTLGLITVSVAVTAVTAPALAVDDVYTPPPPIVHLMVDASGSMQYDVNGSPFETGDYDLQALPVCSLVPGASGKSRYIVATEILAGSLSNYYCAWEDREHEGTGEWTTDCPDCGDPVPMVNGYGTRNSDGLIDRAGINIKFGLATMDTDPHRAVGSYTDYSYGIDMVPDFGAQNKLSPHGKLVVPTPSDALSTIAAQNAAVKQALLTTRPWGQTPLGAFLFDMEYMYETEATFTADPYVNCRDKHILLITDGRQNLDTSNWNTNVEHWPAASVPSPTAVDPYPDPVTEAQRLRSLGFEVWVIAFDVAAGVESDAYNIATYNGTLPGDHYFPIQDIESLEIALLQVFRQVGMVTQSRTRTVYTNNTGNYDDVQYQFNSAFANVPDPSEDASVPGFRQGVLERSVYQCGVDASLPGQSSLAEIQNFATVLNATPDGTRNIYTMVNGNLELFQNANTAITDSMLNAPSGWGPVLDFGRNPETGWCKNGTLSGTREQKVAQWRTNLFNYIRATPDSCRDGYKLGAIYHSTPALQDNLKNIELTIPSFKEYQSLVRTRPFMLYVATHDGQMHAFRTDRPRANTEPDFWGAEQWAYIPRHILGVLGDLPEGRETALDGSPVVADVVFSRTYSTRTSEDGSDWKSVLLFGDRDGGRGYTALDVTNPVNGEWSVLWEISANLGRCPGGSAACNPGGSLAYANNFSRMGHTYGRPAIGTVMICPSESGSCSQSQLEEVAVAVIPGGDSSGLLDPHIGRTVFVVRLDTGAKIAEFATGNVDGDRADVISSCTGNANNIAADMVGDVTCVSTLQGTFMTRCWLGDAAGRLWKMEIGSPARSDWKMTLFYDPYNFQGSPAISTGSNLRAPAYEAPAVSFTRTTGEPVIVFGSGDMDHLTDASRISFVASITDATVEDEPAACTPWRDNVCWRTEAGGLLNGPKLNWKLFPGYDATLTKLPTEAAGARMMGSPIVYGGNAYFTTFTPSLVDQCIPGSGRLYGLDYVQNEGTCAEPMARLSTADDPYDFVTWLPVGSDETGSVPYGVVAIERPTCIGGESIFSAGSGSASGSPLAGSGANSTILVIQTGTDTGEVNETPASEDTLRTIKQTVRTLSGAIQSILVGTWGSVFD